MNVLDVNIRKSELPPIEVLKSFDVVIVSQPEWIFSRVVQAYGSGWPSLNVPKVAIFIETARRDDREFAFGEIGRWFNYRFFPGVQCAREFSGVWLPMGVDTTVFRPLAGVEKVYGASFIGSIYQKRMEYLGRAGLDLTILRPRDDPDARKSFENLVLGYNSTKILVNLPSYSRLVVGKVSEALACKTMCVTPSIDHPEGRENQMQFTDGVDLAYYDPNRPEQLQEVVEYYLNNDNERIRVAESGYEKVVRQYDLDMQLKEVLAEVADVYVIGRRCRFASV